MSHMGGGERASPLSTCSSRLELGFVLATAALCMCSLNLRIDSQTLFVSLVKALGCEDIPLVLAHSQGCAQGRPQHAASRGRSRTDPLGKLKAPLFKSMSELGSLQLDALACRQKKDEHPTRHQSSRTAA